MRQEEERFAETLETGMAILETSLAANAKRLDGETAFKLYERVFGGKIVMMMTFAESPMANLRPPRISKTPPPTLPEGSLKAMLGTCKDYLHDFRDGRDRALIYLFYDCGPRLSGQHTAAGESHQSEGIRTTRGRRGAQAPRAVRSSGLRVAGSVLVRVGSCASWFRLIVTPGSVRRHPGD